MDPAFVRDRHAADLLIETRSEDDPRVSEKGRRVRRPDLFAEPRELALIGFIVRRVESQVFRIVEKGQFRNGAQGKILLEGDRDYPPAPAVRVLHLKDAEPAGFRMRAR